MEVRQTLQAAITQRQQQYSALRSFLLFVLVNGTDEQYVCPNQNLQSTCNNNVYTHKNSKRNFAFFLFIFHFLFFIFMFLFRKTLYRRYLQLYAYLEKEKSLSRSSSLILLSAIVISLEVITHNSRKILQYFNCRCDYCKACLHASVILSQPLEVVLFVHYY